MTFERILWGSEIFTIAPVVGAVGFYYWARRSGRRAWLWGVAGMVFSSLAASVVVGVLRAFVGH